MEAVKVRYVGIDVGKATMVVRILREEGAKVKVAHWHGKTDMKGRESLCAMLGEMDVVGIEAGEPGFTIAREIIERVRAKVLVLNPGRLAIIYRSMRKTDSEDAMKLARLVMRIPEEELPLVTIPTDEERRKRAVISEDNFLSVTRTRIILRLHSVYLRAGITHLSRKDLYDSGKRLDTFKLLMDKPEHFRKEATRLEQLLEPVEKAWSEVKQEMNKELQENELTPVLMSVPGAGPSLTLAYLAYLGDGSRFENISQVSNFVGFVPRIDMSGKMERTGHITKRGCKHIRRIAVQSAWALVRSKEGGVLKEKYQDLRQRRGKKIAIVAIAKKLVELLWVMSRKKELYRYSTPESIKRKYRFYGFNFKGSVA